MIVAYSYMPVVEEILIERLTEYLMVDCKWADQFPNFPQVRINNEFPLVPYMANESFFTDGWLDLNKVSESLFPSVTIITSQDMKSPQVLMKITRTNLEKTELADFITQSETEGYLISPEGLAEIETYFETNDVLYGMNVVYQRRDTVNIDITTDDQTNIKNRLYDLVSLFLVGHGNISLMTDLDIGIVEHSLNGSRSGTYNVEFGRVLRGASMQFEVDYKMNQIFYDTSATVINEVVIDHTVSVKGVN